MLDDGIAALRVADLLDLGLPGLAVNVRDDAVRDSLMTLTTLEPPVVGFVTVWTQQSYGDQLRSAIARVGIDQRRRCGVV